MPLHADIITPDETVYQGDADAVTLTTDQGEITVLPGHVPLITVLAPGVAVVRVGEAEREFAISGGVAEIDGTHVRVLARTADRVEDTQEETIARAMAEAQAVVAGQRADAEGFADAVATLDRELARLKTVRRRRRRL